MNWPSRIAILFFMHSSIFASVLTAQNKQAAVSPSITQARDAQETLTRVFARMGRTETGIGTQYSLTISLETGEMVLVTAKRELKVRFAEEEEWHSVVGSLPEW